MAERDYVAIGLAYARDVVGGKVVAGKLAKLACKRHLKDLERKGDDWPFVFHVKHASDICGFIELLPHVEGKWSTYTIRLEPVQIFI
jgi:phage terminase large subunit-like protein